MDFAKNLSNGCLNLRTTRELAQVKMFNKLLFVVIVSLLLTAHTLSFAAPLFVDEEENNDSEEESVVVCTDCKEDSLGRVEGSDGSKWKQGADDHWRSDTGEDCYYSKSLDKYICK